MSLSSFSFPYSRLGNDGAKPRELLSNSVHQMASAFKDTRQPVKMRLSASQVLGESSLFGDRSMERSTADRLPVGESRNLNAMDSMRELLALHEQQDRMLQREKDRLHAEHFMVTQTYKEIRESKSEIERLHRELAEISSGPVSKMTDEYLAYRTLMEEREEAFRQKWRAEETKVKLLADETKSRLKLVRDHLIGNLDKVDVSNRTMMEAMDELMHVDDLLTSSQGHLKGDSRHASSEAASYGRHAEEQMPLAEEQILA